MDGLASIHDLQPVGRRLRRITCCRSCQRHALFWRAPGQQVNAPVLDEATQLALALFVDATGPEPKA